MRKKRFNSCKLYLILDAEVCPYRHLFDVLKKASFCGVDIVQLRDKLGVARDMLDFSRRAIAWLKGRIPFIINDRIDIARLSGAAGVHLGQDDIQILEARKMLGSRAMIGASCQTLQHVRLAYQQGADYAGFGSVFKTLTKPDRLPMNQGLLSEVFRYAGQKSFPVFAIGGITEGNLGQIIGNGVRRVAICRDILLSKDVRCSVRNIRAKLENVNEVTRE